MKTLTKSLSALALSLLLGGTVAFAGPSNPGAGGFSPGTNNNNAAPTITCPMSTAKTAPVHNHDKTGASTDKVTGYRHQGCLNVARTAMACQTASNCCPAMRH